MKKKRSNPAFMTAVLMIGHLLNTTIPGPAGEAISGWVVQKKYESILEML